MALKLGLGDTTFSLMVASGKKPPNQLSIEYMSKNQGTNETMDAVINLKEFSGQIFIYNMSANELTGGFSENVEKKILAGNLVKKESLYPQNTSEEKIEDHGMIATAESIDSGSENTEKKDATSTPEKRVDMRLQFATKRKSLPSFPSSRHLADQIYKEDEMNWKKNSTFHGNALRKKSHIMPKFLLDDASMSTTYTDDSFNMDDIVAASQLFNGGSEVCILNNRLHEMCKNPDVKINKLFQTLESKPDYASQRDTEGRHPLHLIGNNNKIICEKGKKVRLFIDALIDAYPKAVVAVDKNNCMPFTIAILDWIKSFNDRSKQGNLASLMTKKSVLRITQEAISDETVISENVTTTVLLDWSFKMLSEIFQRLNCNFSNKITFHDGEDYTEDFLDKFSRIPMLLKTCLLIEDSNLRFHLLNMPLFQRCFLRKHFVGDWLAFMLESKKQHSKAIDFFEVFSSLNVCSAFGITSKPRPSEISEFHQKQESMILHIAEMEGLLTSIFLLNDDEKDRACATYLIQRVLDLAVIDASLMGIMVFDFILHLFLLLSYNLQILLHFRPITGMENPILQKPTAMVVLISLYFFIREDVTAISMSQSWKQILKRYFDFWNLVSFISIPITISSTLVLANDRFALPPWIYSINVGLLWLGFLAFLKGMNLHLSILIFSLEKIMLRMQWFFTVLLMSCCIFANMILVMAETDYENLCKSDVFSGSLIPQNYCSGSYFRSLVQAFSIVAGNVSIESYNSSVYIIFIWTCFTVFGVILILNVLIAIVIEVYNGTFMERHRLFGKIRIPLITRHSFIKQHVRGILVSKGEKSLAFIFLSSSIMLFCIWFLFSFYTLISGFLVLATNSSYNAQSYTGIFFSFIFLIIAILALLIFFTKLFKWTHVEDFLARKSLASTISSIKWVAIKVFGAETDREFGSAGEGDELSDDLYRIEEMIERSEYKIKEELHKQLNQDSVI